MIAKFLLVIRVAGAARKWLSEVQANAEARLSMKRAAEDRLWLERIAQALADGNLELLPKWLRPILRILTLNNVFGRYMQALLKSAKMVAKDQTLYRTH